MNQTRDNTPEINHQKLKYAEMRTIVPKLCVKIGVTYQGLLIFEKMPEAVLREAYELLRKVVEEDGAKLEDLLESRYLDDLSTSGIKLSSLFVVACLCRDSRTRDILLRSEYWMKNVGLYLVYTMPAVDELRRTINDAATLGGIHYESALLELQINVLGLLTAAGAKPKPHLFFNSVPLDLLPDAYEYLHAFVVVGQAHIGAFLQEKLYQEDHFLNLEDSALFRVVLLSGDLSTCRSLAQDLDWMEFACLSAKQCQASICGMDIVTKDDAGSHQTELSIQVFRLFIRIGGDPQAFQAFQAFKGGPESFLRKVHDYLFTIVALYELPPGDFLTKDFIEKARCDELAHSIIFEFSLFCRDFRMCTILAQNEDWLKIAGLSTIECQAQIRAMNVLIENGFDLNHARYDLDYVGLFVEVLALLMITSGRIQDRILSQRVPECLLPKVYDYLYAIAITNGTMLGTYLREGPFDRQTHPEIEHGVLLRLAHASGSLLNTCDTLVDNSAWIEYAGLSLVGCQADIPEARQRCHHLLSPNPAQDGALLPELRTNLVRLLMMTSANPQAQLPFQSLSKDLLRKVYDYLHTLL